MSFPKGLYHFPKSQTVFKQHLQSSQLLKAAWTSQGSGLNAPSTLPLDLKPKKQIYDEVAAENPTLATLKLKQSLAYMKAVLSFYKTGVLNVWNNSKELNKLKKQYKITNHLTNKGLQTDIKIPSFQKLTSELCQTLYMSQIENSAEVESGKTGPKTIDTDLFNISRAEYQLIKRTSADRHKLPLFLVVFAVFLEMTPIVCYAIPQITPLTCVLPSILPRLWTHPKYLDETEDLALKSAYNLPVEHVRLLCLSLQLKSKYIPSSLYPESVLRRRLQNYYQYLKVDNYFISGLNGNGSVWDMNNKEVVLAALERNLIANIKEDVSEFNNDTYCNELRLKLIKFLLDFEHFNVGYMTMKHSVNTDAINWR